MKHMRKFFKGTVAVLALTALLVLSLFAFAGCKEKEEDSPEFMPEDTFLPFWGVELDMTPEILAGTQLLSTLHQNGSKIFAADSGLTLYKDGTFDLVLKLDDNALSAIGPLLGNLDFSTLAEADLQRYVDLYVTSLFPGFTLDDVLGSLDLIKNSMGIELLLDYDSPEITALVASLEETGHVNADFALPQKLGVKMHGIYQIEHVHVIKEDGTQQEYTAIALGKMPQDAQPYAMFTLQQDAAGHRAATLRIEFLKLELSFFEKGYTASL